MPKFLIVICLGAVALGLTGCASAPVAAYDEQFCTLKTRDAHGVERCSAWRIGRIAK